jgi:MYXO-CTERM domain-containing protein
MFRPPCPRLAALLAPAALLVASSALAHIDLQEPTARYPRSGNKSCPCGEGDSNRRCDVPAEESSDPNRSVDPEKITRLEVGSTITVRFLEYVNHAGRFRVAFDPDGADLADFNDNVLMDVADPNDDEGPRELQVTLPDTPCDNCTLQVIQAMHGDTENEVLDPAPLSTYFTCADIVLVPKGSLGDPGGSDPGADADAGSGPTDPLDDAADLPASDGGCGVSAGSASGAASGWVAAVGLLLVGLRRRRTRRRPAETAAS